MTTAATSIAGRADDSLGPVLRRTFAPLDAAAFGVAVGLTAAAIVMLLTIFHVVADPIDAPPIELLGQFFYGYDVSWRGALVGGGWALGSGFAAGWTAAVLRNRSLGLWVFLIRRRAELTQTRDFLDHV